MTRIFACGPYEDRVWNEYEENLARYSVWDGGVEIEPGMTLAEAIAFAKGRASVCAFYGGGIPDPEVRLGEKVVWPER